MRLAMSIILACMVWFAAAQAKAEMEAQIAFSRPWGCSTCQIGIGTEDCPGWEDVDLISWDVDNDGNWEVYRGDAEQYGAIFWTYADYDVYTVKVEIIDTSFSPEVTDTATATLWNGEPVLLASRVFGTGQFYVMFDAGQSMPDTDVTYQWDFEYDGSTPSWDSTAETPGHTYTYNPALGNPNVYTCLLRVTWDIEDPPYAPYCESEAEITVYAP